MVNVVPYAASAAWYAAWLRSFSSDCPMEEAIANANISTQTNGKDFARTRIRGNAPGDEILLSVAVVGGASVLKQSRRLSHAILSEHSDWQHNHLGALEASYGRAPFFRYIFPDLKRIFPAMGSRSPTSTVKSTIIYAISSTSGIYCRSRYLMLLRNAVKNWHAKSRRGFR